MKLVIICCACIALVNGISYRKCRRSDPNIEQCFVDGIEFVRPFLNIEPLRIERIHADSAMSGAKVQITLTDVAIYRGSNFKITNLKMNLENRYQYTGNAQIVFPQLYVAANYDTEGTKFMLFNFRSYGQFRGVFTNLVVNMKCVASPYTKRGVEYLKLDSVTNEVTINNGAMVFRPTDVTWFGKLIAYRARTEPGKMIENLIPTMEDTSARLFQNYINDFLSKTPLRELVVD